MPSNNSQAAVYGGLCTQLLSCDPLSLCTSKSLRRDLLTITARLATEGLSFLTKTLPKLGKALDRALEVGRLSIPREFKRSHESGSRPAFMQAYFSQVFDADGVLLDSACPEAISHLRQVLFMFYKLELPYSLEDEARVIAGFIETEEELVLRNDEIHAVNLRHESLIAEMVLGTFDWTEIIPRHGPGAVATGEKLEEKWTFRRRYSSLDRVFPYTEYFTVGGWRETMERSDWYDSLEQLENGCAKVVLVPKDSRGPRLISCEPLEFQWLQQGVGRKLMSHLEASRLTRGHINFTHQTVNRRLALEASVSREWATLDLKDASDRVSVALVEKVFERMPDLLEVLLALRTTETLLPKGGGKQPLVKFAPMGSALCFPVEAFCFWVLTVSAIARQHALPLTQAAKSVYVYGDDLIVRSEYTQTSIEALERVALKVNRDKSFVQGYFRESCGLDAFKGVEVQPTRVRTPWTGKRSDGSAYASWVATANQLSIRYPAASLWLWELLTGTYGFIPYGLPTSGFPNRNVTSYARAVSLNRGNRRMRYNVKLQRVEVRTLKLQTARVRTGLDGWPRLLRNIVSPQQGDPSVTVVPRSVRLKAGWAAL